jgi:hypothetical protein
VFTFGLFDFGLRYNNLQNSLQKMRQDPPTPDVRVQNTIKLKPEDCSFANSLNGARSHTVFAAAESEYPVSVANMLRIRIPLVLLIEPKGLFAEGALSVRPSTRPTITRANISGLEAHSLVPMGFVIDDCFARGCCFGGGDTGVAWEFWVPDVTI